jgi:hypothetical protein
MMLDAALKYTRRGMPVFPIWPALKFERGFTCGCGKGSRCNSPGKHPLHALAPRGLSDATIDERTVSDWWAAWPNANIAIATGGVVVIDIDPRHGGDAALADLETKNGNLPQTWRVKTGGGGTHIYFAGPPKITIKNSVNHLGTGIDVRGQGGYVIAPPSSHISGIRYEWEPVRELAQMPYWLITALHEQRPKGPACSQEWNQLVRSGVAEGKRNDAAARLAGHLLRRYVDPRLTLELVLAWNVTRCQPPLPPFEITTIVNSIARRELERRLAS